VIYNGDTVLSGTLITPDRAVAGSVRVRDDRIIEVAPGPGGPNLIVPGFVDLHCHGGGGFPFPDAEPEQARGAARFHLRHGTTTLMASLISAPRPGLLASVATLAPLVGEGTLAGIHLEGPYLSARRCGAHDPADLRDPSGPELAELVEVGAGTVRMVTMAPERDGALAAIGWLAARGVLPAIGHTDATYHQSRAAIGAGAAVATHLWNGMRPLHHREPGPVAALLEAPEVTCELIPDGIHLHEAALRLATRATGPERLALVTDAIAAAGLGDGEFDLAGRRVVVSDRAARLATERPDRTGHSDHPAPLAGSTLTMDAALRRTAAAGIPLVQAVRMAATTPARTLGLAGEVGALVPGLRADLVVLDPDLNLLQVMRAGHWV
jgi:N-acetylglucosamine-6-phosphate deacetylase